MGWISELLGLNAKIFNLLNDVDALNTRLSKVDNEVRDLGREVAQLKGYLAATEFKFSDRMENQPHSIEEIQRKVDEINYLLQQDESGNKRQ